MLTPNDIRNVVFTKGMGGYKTSEVDVFIDECADTVEALIKEKTAAVEALNREKQDLQKKLEVLADKLVEYRNDEDSIRTALLSAQRLGDATLREANHKASLIMDDAKIKADKIVETARQNIVDEEKELERIQKEVALFKSRMLAIYREHLALIDVLPEIKEEEAEPEPAAPAEAPAAEEKPAVEEIQVTVTDETPAAVEETVIVNTETTAAAAEDSAFAMRIPQIDEEEEVPLVSADSAARPASRFENLKFGDEYDLANDPDGDQPSGLFRRSK